MADETKRVIDQTTDSSLSAGDYVIVDSESEGTRKFDLGTELTGIKQDLANLDTSGVPANVRQAMKTLFESSAYTTTGLEDEMAVISSWASQVTAITLNQSSISISGSGTYQLIATTTPSGGTVTWSSSNTAVATVSSNGLVTSVSNGTAVITATSGDVSATCTVTISGFATLTSISAVYTQSGTVYDTDTLDSLKTDLVVTAHWDVGADTTVSSTDYTLSGTLDVGTSTITVSYGGKTDTFNVTVSEVDTSIHNWDFKTSLVDSVGGITAILTGKNSNPPVQSSAGLEFVAQGQCVDLGAVWGYQADRTYEIDVEDFDMQVTGQHIRFVMYGTNNGATTGILIFRKNSNIWTMYTGSWGSGFSSSLNTPNSIGTNFKLTLKVTSTGVTSLYIDDVLIGTDTVNAVGASGNHVYIGNYAAVSDGANLYNCKITGVRVYEGV